MKRLTGLLLVLCCAGPGRAETPAQAARVAAAHLGTLGGSKRPYTRFLSLHGTPPEKRPQMMQAVSFAVNSLSREPVIAVPPLVGGLVAYVDLQAYGIDPRDWDRLGVKGSGPAPFPDPFFHLVEERHEDEYKVVEYGHWAYDNYGHKQWVRTETREERAGTRRTFHADPRAPWLPADAAVALAVLADSESPILDARWFITNALIEPRYHELLGLGNREADFQKLAFVDEGLADRAGGQRRGVVLLSEVAHRNRALERTPTAVRAGRGYYWESLDFLKSVRQDDLLADLLQDKADAREVITSLPNGLQAYFIADGRGKRLDFANPEVAVDGRTRLKDKLVWTARNCIGCHDSERGVIPVDDEVRAMAKPQLQLLVDQFSRTDPRRSKRVRDRYLLDDVNELVAADQAAYETAAVTAAGGLRAPARAGLLESVPVDYWDRPVTLAGLEADTGYPAAVIRAAVEASSASAALITDPKLQARAAPNHALVGAALGRRQRRDQAEASLNQLLLLLSAAGGK